MHSSHRCSHAKYSPKVATLLACSNKSRSFSTNSIFSVCITTHKRDTHSLKCSSHLLLENTETVIADLWRLASISYCAAGYTISFISRLFLGNLPPQISSRFERIRRDTFCLYYRRSWSSQYHIVFESDIRNDIRSEGSYGINTCSDIKICLSSLYSRSAAGVHLNGSARSMSRSGRAFVARSGMKEL